MSSKTCSQCKETKPLSEFSPNKKMKSGRQPACKKCLTARKAEEYRKNRQRYLDASKRFQAKHHRRYKSYMLKRYGLNIDQYETMLAAQNNCCAICKAVKPGGHGTKYFHVDHDHYSKQVRGLLCTRCNMGLGYFTDNTDKLSSATNYLLKTQVVNFSDIYASIENKTEKRFLYKLLKERDDTTNISHGKMPTFSQHCAFVDSMPYQFWYIIYFEKIPVGQIYLTHPAKPSRAGDEIGIQIAKNHQGKKYAKRAIHLLMKRHPKERFLANISPKNGKSIAMFEDLGFALCQYTLVYRPPPEPDLFSYGY